MNKRGEGKIVALRQILHSGDDRFGYEAPRPRIDPDRERGVRLVRLIEQARQQADGEIVDRFPSQIFQHAQRDAFAGPGHAGNDHDALAVRAVGRIVGGGLRNHRGGCGSLQAKGRAGRIAAMPIPREWPASHRPNETADAARRMSSTGVVAARSANRGAAGVSSNISASGAFVVGIETRPTLRISSSPAICGRRGCPE